MTEFDLEDEAETSEWRILDVSRDLNQEARELLRPDAIHVSKPVATRWLGQVDYVQAQLDVTETQKQRSEIERVDGLEHPLTITLGRRADPLKDIKAPLKVLRERNIQIVGAERGGQATLHNQGQLVIYPYIHLTERKMRVREYIKCLEVTTKQLLRAHGIEAICKGDEPGLYTLSGKIAFFGVRVKHGWTSHGVAINVRNNIDDFAFIRSCGQATETFSRMQDYGVTAPLSFLFQQWCEIFRHNLDPIA